MSTLHKARRRMAVAVAGITSILAITAPAAAAPANDNFEDASPISELVPQTVNFDGATRQPGEPRRCGFRDQTVWFKYTPLTDLRVQFSALEVAAFGGHSIALYTGDQLSTLRLIACDDGSTFPPPILLSLDARTDTTYYVQVAGRLPVRVHLEPMPSGDVSGRLTDSSGSAVANVCIEVWGSFPLLTSLSDASGRYRISLQPGRYTVRFWDCGDIGYAEEWYADAPQQSGARPIDVLPDEETTGVDGVLTRLGSISGVLRTPDGSPVVGACVYGWPESGNIGDHRTFVGDGSYRLYRLMPGRYRVKFAGCGFGSEDRYVSEWYDNVPSWTDATWIEVGEGQTVTGTDATLVPL